MSGSTVDTIDTVLYLSDFGLRNVSKFVPPQNNHMVEAFVDLVQEDMTTLRQKVRRFNYSSTITEN